MSPATIRTLTFVARCAVIGLAAAFLLSVLAPDLVSRLRGAKATGTTRTAIVGRAQGPVSYAEAVSRASPAVVNIYANKITTYLAPRQELRDSLTMRLLGIVQGRPMRKLQQNLGSGVVFTADGYVLTNNHVVAGADDIQVGLDNGAAHAQVVGTDAETDLAVLKIDAKDLPTIDIPDDAAVDVGDVVLAIGNPVGIGKTVTMGIVSATGRQLRMSNYEDFIQTDAAINAGNSGGALVNATGELVGINTAVYPRTPTSDGRTYTPGAEGIGFAIPVATAKAVLEQIIKNGKVIRGWIGADYTDLPLQAGATQRQRGVFILRVIPESPAAQTGLQPGDVLQSLDGSPIVDQIDLLNREAALAPGTKVHVEGLRRNAPFSADLTLVQRPPPSTTGA
ncbi:MAG TPA: trypsin-like peptidase domain-containing protein [Rhodanobacteraceae bacterium]|jgi:serine protease DegS/serine protease DegQ|nr:trypsin-like peptidase domain-containing protein [Rhodanobacteraceae bacterium]